MNDLEEYYTELKRMHMMKNIKDDSFYNMTYK